MAKVEKDFIKLTSDPLVLQDIVDLVKDDQAGAISTFCGTTHKTVVRLEYESYIPMAEKEISSIITDVRTKWQLMKVAVYHRLGIVPVGETSVIIAVSSVHRHESLKAAEWLIDTLKEKVPIWKKEIYNDGSSWKENTKSKCC
ncbi:Molybdopterin biosynthesis MoaE [Gigaspora margarita]|uniref:Molybdopterin synthase catalytic subunit n=1 Tax=Gigaspora margarita TaxID=4874 RepID=A0A8H4A6A8_GIGMA|nr:Molybdopterin biosynthesis MoaE [Gigaspora margarita]